MKLIIQIPCYNEELTLPLTLKDLPRQIPGIDRIEIQVINDGSEDRTVEVARRWGVDHVISFKSRRGLAAAFKAGVDSALSHNADILVNTDADNQYCGWDIAKLVQPVIEGKADMVVGCRPIKDHPEFSPLKKMLQRLGSLVLRNISGTTVRDAASGFRAYSRSALLRLNVYSDFSYCMETLIQAGLNNIKVTSVDIRVNPKTRESRLFRSIAGYIYRQTRTMLGIFLIYRAKTIFFGLSALFMLASGLLLGRYLYLVEFRGSPAGSFWPTIVLSGVLLAMSLQTLFTGWIATLVGANRHLEEEIVYRLRRFDVRTRAAAEIPQDGVNVDRRAPGGFVSRERDLGHEGPEFQ